jgi:hypothetical protein
MDTLKADSERACADLLGEWNTTICRWAKTGIPLARCDQLACRAGSHPLLVWGAAWRRAEDAHAAFRDLARERRNDRASGYREARKAA